MKSQLYDPAGVPLAYSWSFYESGTPSFLADDITTQTFIEGNQDTDKLLPTDDWRQLLNSSRFLFANSPLIRGAIMEQATLSFPLVGQYVGKDKDWGKLAEEWLLEGRRSASNVGPMFDDSAISRMRLI